MTTIPTQNAVPSEAPRDLKFNSGKIDEFVTSLEHEYKDRFGRCHMTIEGMRWVFEQLMERFKVDINQAIVAAGYIPMDSFQKGAEITKRNEILRDETTGEYYRWDGDLPKSVPIGSTPESAGGIGMGAWVSVGDASLRSELSKPTGAGLVGAESGKTVQSEISKLINMSDRLRSSKYSMHGAGKSLGAENTIISCSLLANYFDVIDVDLSTTSDGVAILMHDTNSTPLDGVTGSVSEYNYSQIKDRRNLLFDNTPFEGTAVTTWDEFMLFCASRGKYVTAELKNTQGTESSMLGIYNPIVNNNMLGRVNLQCLNVSRLKDYRIITNDKITQLLTLVYDGMPNEDLDYVILETLSLGNGGIHVDINYSKINELIEKAELSGLPVGLWAAKQYSDEISILGKFPGHQISTDYMVV